VALHPADTKQYKEEWPYVMHASEPFHSIFGNTGLLWRYTLPADLHISSGCRGYSLSYWKWSI